MQKGDGDGTCSCKEIPEVSMRQPEKDQKKHNVIFEEPFWFWVKSQFNEMSQTSTYTYFLFQAFRPFQPFFSFNGRNELPSNRKSLHWNNTIDIYPTVKAGDAVFY